MNIVHHADVTTSGQVLTLSELTGILAFTASLLNVPIVNVG